MQALEAFEHVVDRAKAGLAAKTGYGSEFPGLVQIGLHGLARGVFFSLSCFVLGVGLRLNVPPIAFATVQPAY